MVEKKTWTEFRATGMMWFANRILHIFGWAIVMDIEDDGSISDVYPARVKFRGFSEDIETENYIKVSQFMKENAPTLLKEAQE